MEDLCIGEVIAVTALATATAHYLNSPQGQESIAATLSLVTTGLDKASQALGNLISSKSDKQGQSDPATGSTTQAKP